MTPATRQRPGVWPNPGKGIDMTHSRRPKALVATEGLADRLLARGVRAPNGCLEWSGSRDSFGYGWIWDGQRTVKVHRAAFAAFIRPLEPGELVCHRCDNPPCFDPEHLFAGTRADNNRDMFAKGRAAHNIGPANPNTILTADQVAEIRLRRNAGELGSDLALEFEVHRNTIYAACNGQSWRHIT